MVRLRIDLQATNQTYTTKVMDLKCRPWKRRRLQLKWAAMPLMHHNRRRLSRILDRLVRAHNWKEACGVLSILLKWSPIGNSLMEDRRNFLAAMEIQRRLGGEGTHYRTKIKKIYEAWMNKIIRMPRDIKRYSIQMELALFYVANESIEEALNITKILVQDRDSASEPTINLMHGLLLCQVWYSGLPEDMQIKRSDAHMLSFDASMTDGYEEPEIFASSNEHNAIDIEDANNSYGVASESSVGNEKSLDHKGNVKQQNDGDLHTTEFSLSGSGLNADRPLNPHRRLDRSIFLAHGLEKTSLLPVRLDHLSGDLEHIISSYRSLTNEQYDDAVKHLRLALHSTPPLSAAMLPLVQLLLLGDHVDDALIELENCCCNSTDALPLRLRARIMESLRSNQVSTICSLYEDALTRDPTCKSSLERLIKMHRIGNYDTIPLFDMIVLHLDNADGNSSIWEEFASCLVKILTSPLDEDRVSANVSGSSSGFVSCGELPSVFADRETWKVRWRWWRDRHFSKKALEMQHGEWKLLAAKAACASHLYGPHFGYVEAALGSLTTRADNILLSYLQMHLKNFVCVSEYFTEYFTEVNNYMRGI